MTTPIRTPRTDEPGFWELVLMVRDTAYRESLDPRRFFTEKIQLNSVIRPEVEEEVQQRIDSMVMLGYEIMESLLNWVPIPF